MSLATNRNVAINSGVIATLDTQGYAMTIPGVISGSGSLAKVGSGTLTLSGSNSYTGSTTINAGTLLLDFSQAGATTNILPATAALILGGGTLSMTGGSGSNSTQTLVGVTLSQGASAVTATNGSGHTATLNLGTISRVSGSTVNFTLPGGSGSITNATQVIAPTILGGWATVGNTDWAVAPTAGTTGYIIAALSSYSTTFQANANVDAPTGTRTPNTRTINSLRFNTAGTYAVNGTGTLTVATGGILETSGVGTNAVSIDDSALTSGNGRIWLSSKTIPAA